MTHSDLERELRDHYRSIDSGSGGRATARVAEALDRALARRRNFGRLVPSRTVLGAITAIAAAVALAVALMPLWRAPATGPGASPTTSTASPIASPSAGHSPDARIAAAKVSQAGITADGTVWAVRGGGLYLSADHGATWNSHLLPADAPLGDGAPAPFVSVVDAAHAWVGGAFRRTTDGGANWQLTDLPAVAGGEWWNESLVDAGTGFVVMSEPGGSAILGTTDGGASWNVVHTTAKLFRPVVASDARTLWTYDYDQAPGPRTLLRVSRDAGATWSDVTLPGLDGPSEALYIPGGPTGGVTFLSATEGYVAAFQRTASALKTFYFRTTDGGRTWSQAASLAQQVMVAPVFLDATHWYQPGMGEFAELGYLGLGVTADGGKTWTTVAENGLAPGTPVAFFWTADGRNGAAVGLVDPSSGNGTVALFLTGDGGKTWRPADFSAR